MNKKILMNKFYSKLLHFSIIVFVMQLLNWLLTFIIFNYDAYAVLLSIILFGLLIVEIILFFKYISKIKFPSLTFSIIYTIMLAVLWNVLAILVLSLLVSFAGSNCDGGGYECLFAGLEYLWFWLIITCQSILTLIIHIIRSIYVNIKKKKKH